MKCLRIPRVALMAMLVSLSFDSAEAHTAQQQADAFHARGVAAEQRGDLVAAENCYTLALRVNAGHQGAQASLAGLEEKLPQELRLDEVTPTEAKVGWGRYLVNKYNEDRQAQILIDGRPCEHYLFTHANSVVSFKVPPRFSRFTALGIGPTKPRRKEYSWTYQVRADGKVLYTSKRLDTYPGNRVEIDVEIPVGTGTITLITDTSGSGFADHSVWAEPKLLRSTLSPETKAKLAELETWFKKACASVPASQLKGLYAQYDALLASLATSLAHMPAEAAAVNAVRSRAAAALPVAPVTATTSTASAPVATPPPVPVTVQNPKLLLPRLSAETKARLDQLANWFGTARAAKVEPVYAQAIQTLRPKYLIAVQRGAEAAQRAGDQAGFAALQEEIKLVEGTNPIPEADPTGTPTALVNLRGNYRASMRAVEANRAALLKPLYDQYDGALAALAQSLAGKSADVTAINAVRATLTAERQTPNLQK